MHLVMRKGTCFVDLPSLTYRPLILTLTLTLTLALNPNPNANPNPNLDPNSNSNPINPKPNLFHSRSEIGWCKMPESMVYIGHHKFLGTYTKPTKIVIMNDKGELNIPDACDSPVTVITSELFLDLISGVCPDYVKTSETWFSQEQPPADVGGENDVGAGGADVGFGGGGEGVDLGVKDVGGEGKDVGGEGKDVEGKGKDVGGKGTDVGGRVKDVGGRGKGVGGRGKDVEGKGKDVGGEGKDVGGKGKDVGGKGTDVGGKGTDVGARGKGVGGRGKDVGARGKGVGGNGKGVRGRGKQVGVENDVGVGGNDVEAALRELRLSDLDQNVHSNLKLYAIMSMFYSRLDPAAFETLTRTVVDEKAKDFFANSNVILSSAITVPRKGE